MKNKNIGPSLRAVTKTQRSNLCSQIASTIFELLSRKDRINIIFVIALFIFPFSLLSAETQSPDQTIKKHNTTFYRDFFDQIIYYPLSKPLRWDRLATRWIGKESLDINIFDEVPDSSFFQNRIGRHNLSIDEITKGPNLPGPSQDGNWTVLKGKAEGVTSGFLIRDSQGQLFLLKLDPTDMPEMSTSTEIIGHKFFHAIGYHVPQYNLVYFTPEKLVLASDATFYDHRGFKEYLKQKDLESMLQKAPLFKGGVYRASASRILSGDSKGFMPFEGVRRGDPDDLIPHEDRRTIRALHVFASWLNHYDLRVGNTLDLVVEEDGKKFVKHYLIDFGSLLGSAGSHEKYPAAVHENVIDWRAIGKAFAILKVDDKPWEKRWDINERQITYPSIGYFDNFKFKPEDWRSQLPYEAFNRVTEADGYWAAKIIARFSDEMIGALVKKGEFSDSKAEEYLTKTLIDRRDMVVRHWFSKVVPIEDLSLSDQGGNIYKLEFKDLAVANRYNQPEGVMYRFRIGKNKWQEFTGNSFNFNLDPNKPKETLYIQKRETEDSSWTSLAIRIHFEHSGNASKFQISGIERGRS